MRDVLNKVNEIHFTSRDEIHTLGLLYESMLKEMRDAAGDSGEFYTPRPVVKFIVSVIHPQLGDTVLDPAATHIATRLTRLYLAVPSRGTQPAEVWPVSCCALTQRSN